MKKTHKNTIWDLIMGTIFGTIVLPIMFVYKPMVDIMLSQIGEATIETGAMILKDYSMVCLTLFGFTLIGGIFNIREKDKNRKWDRVELTKRTLLVLSLIFLLSFILLQMSYSMLYPVFNESNLELIRSLFIFGLLFYVMGIIMLFIVLIGFFFFRYTHIPEFYEKMKSRMVDK